MAFNTPSVLATTLEEWLTDQISDTFFDKTDVSRKILQSRAGSKVDGGDEIKWTVQADGVTAAGQIGFIADGTSFNLSSQDHLVEARINWSQAGVATERDRGDFDVYNRGRGRVINLSASVLDNLKEQFRTFNASTIWQNTTPANGYIPLPVAIDDGVLAASTYANISPAAVAGWRSYGQDLAGAVLTVSDISDALDELKFRDGAEPDMIVTGFRTYNTIKREAFGAVRHPNVSTGKTELAIDTFTISGVPVVIDPFMNDSTGDAGAGAASPRFYNGTNKTYLLSTKDIAYIPQPAGNHAGQYKTIDGIIRCSNWIDMAQINLADKYRILMYFYGALAVLNRRNHGVLYNHA